MTALIKKAYPQVYQNLDSFQWSPYMHTLIEEIRQKIRLDMLTLIPKIYTSIELSQLANYFGTNDVLPGKNEHLSMHITSLTF